MSEDYKIFEDFSQAIDIGVIVIELEGTPLFTSKKYNYINNILSKDFYKVFDNDDQFGLSLLYGSYQANRFGGKYIFFSSRGLIYFASPLLKNGQMVASVLAGPLLMTDYDDYLELDIARKYLIEDNRLSMFREQLKVIPVVSPERVKAMSEQLYINTSYYCGEEYQYFEHQSESQQLQAFISEHIAQVRSKGETSFYPLDKEEALLKAMSRGDKFAAKGLLNEILGHLFFYNGGAFEVIRSRVIELIVLLSRAAVKGGADAELVFGLNYQYLQEIDQFKSLDQITYWLSRIMNRFTDYVFDFVEVKHLDVIYKAINYLKINYMKKLTLEEVAKYVYLSSTYLSKVFKEETGYNFNHYLNIIRIDESKKLLKNTTINLVDISSMVGFEDQSYFTKVFKKIEGISPGKYRQITVKI